MEHIELLARLTVFSHITALKNLKYDNMSQKLSVFYLYLNNAVLMVQS